MKPSQIYYSQNSINERFDNGYTIYATLNACKNHPFVNNEIPPKKGRQVVHVGQPKALGVQKTGGTGSRRFRTDKTSEPKSSNRSEIYHDQRRGKCGNSQ